MGGGWLGGVVGGATGELKNKAQLSLNWVCAGTLAELGDFKEKLSVHKLFHCAREAFMSMLVRIS